MYAGAKSYVDFYRYDLRTFLQGEKASTVTVVTTWRDGYNKPHEMKKILYLSGSEIRDTTEIQFKK